MHSLTYPSENNCYMIQVKSFNLEPLHKVITAILDNQLFS